MVNGGSLFYENEIYKSFIHQTNGSTDRDRQSKKQHKHARAHTHIQSRIKTLYKNHMLDFNMLSIKSINNVSNYIVTVQLTFS